jgi:PAS domain S-box-containing protein
MVLAYDMDRKLVSVNPAVETLTGYSMEELEKANFICWIHPDDQPRMLAFWETLFQGKSVHEEEYRLVTKDGRVKSVVSSWTPILDDCGHQVGVLGREFDITLRKLAETALHHSEEKLRVNDERYRVLFENSPFPMWEEDFSDVKRYLDSLVATGVSDIHGHLGCHRAAVEECVRRVRIQDADVFTASGNGAILSMPSVNRT